MGSWLRSAEVTRSTSDAAVKCLPVTEFLTVGIGFHSAITLCRGGGVTTAWFADLPISRCATILEGAFQLRHCLEQVSNQSIIGHLENWRIGVAVDGDDDF